MQDGRGTNALGDRGTNAVGGDSSLTPADPAERARASGSERRRRYEAPRIERRIPIVTNTMQTTSGTDTFFTDE